MQLIDREIVKEIFRKEKNRRYPTKINLSDLEYACLLAYAIENAPEVDPVKYGHWNSMFYGINHGCDVYKYTCSECGFSANNESHFCPDCGAKMDEQIG